MEDENELLKQIEERTSKIHTVCGGKTTQMVYPLSECDKELNGKGKERKRGGENVRG